MASFIWQNPQHLKSREFICGHCSREVASISGYVAHQERLAGVTREGYICPNCRQLNYFDERGGQLPGPVFCKSVESLPTDVETLYREARDCMKVSAYSPCVLSGRKILMHVAVEKGAKPGESFISYVDHLEAKNYVPPDGKAWVDYIRGLGNEATHQIALMGKEQAQTLLTFVEMLLRIVYEFPKKVPAKKP